MSDSDSDDSDYVPSGEEKNYSVEENSLDEIDETDYNPTQDNINSTQVLQEIESKPLSTQNVWNDFLKSVNPIPSSHQKNINAADQPESTKSIINDDTNTKQDPSTQNASTSRSPEVSKNCFVEKTKTEGETNAQKRPNSEIFSNGLNNNNPPRGLTDFKSLESLRKKSKVTTLDMTKNSWEQFKADEYGLTPTENGLTDMDIHNRGKGGYLDRMEFLSKTDNLRFEIEKNLRNSARK